MSLASGESGGLLDVALDTLKTPLRQKPGPLENIRGRLERGVTVSIGGLGAKYRMTMDRDGNVHGLRDDTRGVGDTPGEAQDWQPPAAACEQEA